MKAFRRREFLGAAAAGGAGLMGARLSALNIIPRSAFSAPQAADARIEILLNEKIGRISPDIYGHFVERLGGVCDALAVNACLINAAFDSYHI